MITLHTFGPAFGLPDASPFVTKADMLLKLSGLPYHREPSGLRNAPKGKLPYIEDDGIVVPDSTFIRWHLEKKYRIDFDEGLSPEARGIAWAMEKLLEDNLYWISIQARWLDDANFKRGPTIFFKGVPWPLRPVIEAVVRRQVAKNARAHGMGRHQQEEQMKVAAKTFESVSAVLGDKPYLMGGKPCGADATVFAFVLGSLCPHFESPLRREAEKHANLVRYVERMRGLYYDDVQEAAA